MHYRLFFLLHSWFKIDIINAGLGYIKVNIEFDNKWWKTSLCIVWYLLLGGAYIVKWCLIQEANLNRCEHTNPCPSNDWCCNKRNHHPDLDNDQSDIYCISDL